MAEAAEDQDETAGQDVDKTPCRRTGQRGRAGVMTCPDAPRRSAYVWRPRDGGHGTWAGRHPQADGGLVSEAVRG